VKLELRDIVEEHVSIMGGLKLGIEAGPEDKLAEASAFRRRALREP
jgi:hypothetical protein